MLTPVAPRAANSTRASARAAADKKAASEAARVAAEKTARAAKAKQGEDLFAVANKRDMKAAAEKLKLKTTVPKPKPIGRAPRMTKAQMRAETEAAMAAKAAKGGWTMAIRQFAKPTMHGTSPLRSDRLGGKFDHPAKHLSRSENDPMGGPQHRDSGKASKPCRKGERLNPANSKPRAA
jgi:hypothetical protein